jgi:chaperonin GroES
LVAARSKKHSCLESANKVVYIVVAKRLWGFLQPKNLGGSAMQFRPLHDRVVVRRIEEDERTPGGIIIPDTAKEKPQQGEVIAAGPGARDEKGHVQPLDVKAGDRVLFGKWSGTEVKIDGEELLIMKESDIMGVLEGAAASKKKAA